MNSLEHDAKNGGLETFGHTPLLRNSNLLIVEGLEMHKITSVAAGRMHMLVSGVELPNPNAWMN